MQLKFSKQNNRLALRTCVCIVSFLLFFVILCRFKMLKVSRVMATSLKILVANTQFSVMLETSWSQCQTLLLTLRWIPACSAQCQYNMYLTWHYHLLGTSPRFMAMKLELCRDQNKNSLIVEFFFSRLEYKEPNNFQLVTYSKVGQHYLLSNCGLINNCSPKWRWLAVDIYRAAKREVNIQRQPPTLR